MWLHTNFICLIVVYAAYHFQKQFLKNILRISSVSFCKKLLLNMKKSAWTENRAFVYVGFCCTAFKQSIYCFSKFVSNSLGHVLTLIRFSQEMSWVVSASFCCLVRTVQVWYESHAGHMNSPNKYCKRCKVKEHSKVLFKQWKALK